MVHYFTKKLLQQNTRGQLREAKQKKGIISDPLIEFIEPSNYIFLQLHFEIGAANNVMDNLRCFIEEEVEQLSNEEKTTRNSVIMADVSLQKAKEASEQWKRNGGVIDLHMYRMERVNVNNALKGRNLNQEARVDLMDQKQWIENLIERHVQEQKRLQQDLTLKRKQLKEARSALKKIQSEKTKMDNPTIAEVENLLSDYGITPAKYHGGKLNGVDCREVMSHAKTLFEQIKTLLLSVSRADQCSDAQVKHVCRIHRDIFVTLDTISSKIRMKNGEPTQEDFEILKRSLLSLDDLWTQASMSYTPKIHGILSHAAEQVQ